MNYDTVWWVFYGVACRLRQVFQIRHNPVFNEVDLTSHSCEKLGSSAISQCARTEDNSKGASRNGGVCPIYQRGKHTWKGCAFWATINAPVTCPTLRFQREGAHYVGGSSWRSYGRWFAGCPNFVFADGQAIVSPARVQRVRASVVKTGASNHKKIEQRANESRQCDALLSSSGAVCKEVCSCTVSIDGCVAMPFRTVG